MEEKYQCKNCPKNFQTSEGLEIHIANDHVIDIDQGIGSKDFESSNNDHVVVSYI